LALMVDGTPEIHPLAGDPHHQASGAGQLHRELALDLLQIFDNGEDAGLAATMLVMALAAPISSEDRLHYLAAPAQGQRCQAEGVSCERLWRGSQSALARDVCRWSHEVFELTGISDRSPSDRIRPRCALPSPAPMSATTRPAFTPSRCLPALNHALIVMD